MSYSPRHKLALTIALKASVKASSVLQTVLNSNRLGVSKKTRGQLPITRADLGAEQAIIATIRENWDSSCEILSEHESSLTNIGQLQQDSLWVVDSINGTVNYARGDSQCAISIAAVWDQKIQVGVVCSPFEQDTYYAVLGSGAFKNKARIHCSQTKRLDRSLIATNFPLEPEARSADTVAQKVASLLPRVLGLRCIGCPALSLCHVATGHYEGYFDSAKVWELAAARLIAKEAGATVGCYRPQMRNFSEIEVELRSDHFIAACPTIYTPLELFLGSRQV